jgi:precorrin-6B methylase 2
MRIYHLLTCWFVFLFITTTVSCNEKARDQRRSETNTSLPDEGLEGKDVPYITTPQPLVEKMLSLAEITPKDYLIDLGSGDGRTVITAAKRGTRALGIEYNPELVEISKKIAEKEGVSDRVRFVEADLYEYDFSEATVISMFLLPEINMRLRPKLLNLKPGTRIVTNTFTMQDWHYDGVAKTGDESNRWNTAYLWIVPAKVQGVWSLPEEGELVLKQRFQMLTGSITTGNKEIAITEGKLRGNEITFNAGGAIYKGVVAGNRMEGTFTSGSTTKKWTAVSRTSNQ